MPESGDISQPDIAKSPIKELTTEEKEVRDLFRLSFMFSQGDKKIQNNIFEWLALNGKLDKLTIPEHPPAYIMSISAPKKHTEEYGQKEKESTQLEIKQRWDYFYSLSIRNGNERLKLLNKNAVLEDLLVGLLERDSNYQIDVRPSRNGTEGIDTIPDSDDDPHASFLRRYVLNHESLDISAFDDLLKNVSEVFTPRVLKVDRKQAQLDIINPPRYEDLDQLRQIGILQNLWERNHPGEVFFPMKQAT